MDADDRTEVYRMYADALVAAGYDVVVADVVTARFDRGDHVREVVVDRGGRFRLTVTRRTAPGKGKRVRRGAWTFRTLQESQQITSVTCVLGEPEELTAMLAEAERLAGPVNGERDEGGSSPR